MLYPDNNKLVEDFVQLLKIKRYSKRSIEVYRSAVLKFISPLIINAEQITRKEIESYINKRVTEEKISLSTQKQIVGALKLFYNTYLDKRIEIDYLYPDRSEKKLPNVLSKEEVRSILNSINNLKHKTIITCIYSSGLRISELIDLKIEDIDSKRMLINLGMEKGTRIDMFHFQINYLYYLEIITELINQRNIFLKDKILLNILLQVLEKC